MSNGFLREFSKKAILAIIALLVAEWAFMPGYPALDMPAHSDLWRYYVVSQEQTLRAALMSPRPLMLVFLHLLKIIKDPAVFFISLNLPSIFFVSSLVVAMEKVWGRIVPSAFVGCCYVLIFSMPTFYELNPLDFGGMLAGTVSSLALFWMAGLRDKDIKFRIFRESVIFFLLSFASVETKPTFAIILPFFSLILYGVRSNKSILILSVASIAAIGCSVVKDLILNSPFISFSGSHANPYHVEINPRPMLLAIAQYARCIVPVAWLPIVFLAAFLAARKNLLLALALVGAPFLVIAPMGAIPTRVLPMYSWFATATLAIFVLCALNVLLLWKRHWLVVVSLLFSFAPVAFGYQPNQQVVPWIMANQAFNRNSLKGLNAIIERVAPGEHILIAGKLMPYSPFQNDQFIQLIAHVPFDWKVAYPATEAPFAAMSNDTRSMIPQSSVDLRQFNRVAIFSPDGRLVSFTPARNFSDMTVGELEATFYCGAKLSISDVADRAARVMSCLNDIGEFDASVQYGNGVPLNARNQWTWFMYGRANEGIKNYKSAYDSYEHAYSIERAQVFRKAMDDVLAISTKMQ